MAERLPDERDAVGVEAPAQLRPRLRGPLPGPGERGVRVVAADRRGTVSHKAIELSVSWRGDPSAGELVDEAHRPAHRQQRPHQRLPGRAGRGRAGRAARRGHRAGEHVPRVLPDARAPLAARRREPPAGRPATATGSCCRGKVDLTVGRADGPAGRQGAHRPQDRRLRAQPPRRPALLRPHRDAAARRAAPPAGHLLPRRRPAAGRGRVTRTLLAAAFERVVGGADAAVALRHEGREPVLRPGPPCRWCPLPHTCDVGQRCLEERGRAGRLVSARGPALRSSPMATDPGH